MLTGAVAGGTKLLEIVIGGSGIVATSGLAQVHLQQQRRIALGVVSGLAEHHLDAALGSHWAPPETARKAVVAQKKTVAALAVKPQERHTNSSFSVSSHSIESRDNQGFERERSPSSIGPASPQAAAASHPQTPLTSSHFASLKPPDVALLQKYVANLPADSKIRIANIAYPPPRSPSRSRHAAAAIDAHESMATHASTAGLPPPPSLWRSSSYVAESEGTQALSNAEFGPGAEHVLACMHAVHCDSSSAMLHPTLAAKPTYDDPPPPFTEEDMGLHEAAIAEQRAKKSAARAAKDQKSTHASAVAVVPRAYSNAHGKPSSAAVEDWGPPPTFTEEDMRLHEAAEAEMRARKAAARAAKARDQKRQC